ncbi:MAG: hypothetical protein ACX930_10315 [Erythrobacter sp.]
MRRKTIRSALAAIALVAGAPLMSQTLEQLDAIADRSADEQSGIAAAREQIVRGELLQALATLERVLTQFPRSAEARFNHALLLCWIDDPQGAVVEFERLDEDDYAEGALEQAVANCRAATQGSAQ